jgi:hypothetical protein
MSDELPQGCLRTATRVPSGTKENALALLRSLSPQGGFVCFTSQAHG